MFSYYGSKSKIVHLYPPPKFNTVIEPFAGSARYALRHFRRDVILIDKYDKIIAVWKYLQSASENDVLTLPMLRAGESLNDHKSLADAERWFIGFHINGGSAMPKVTVKDFNMWTPVNRQYAARSLYKIRHWKFVQGEYDCLANIEATWFIDPPYFQGGEHYRHGTNKLDFTQIADYAQSRNGQVIVCENSSATWMPFMKLTKMHGSLKTTTEVWWTNETEPQQSVLF